MNAEQRELAQVLAQALHWPPDMRIRLARQLLDSVDEALGASTPRGVSAAAAIAAVNSRLPAPDDATVKQWLEEHRAEKYGR